MFLQENFLARFDLLPADWALFQLEAALLTACHMSAWVEYGFFSGSQADCAREGVFVALLGSATSEASRKGGRVSDKLLVPPALLGPAATQS